MFFLLELPLDSTVYAYFLWRDQDKLSFIMQTFRKKPWVKLYFSCLETENFRQKCSRLIFVWTHGGRGINFLDGHGIHFNVSFWIFKLNFQFYAP